MNPVKSLFSKPYTGILVALTAAIILFASLNPTFITPLNIATMLRAMSYTGIIAIGMALCLISGVIDLSVGCTASLASVAFGAFLVDYHIPLIPAALMTIAMGACVGAFNAFIILKMKITPFIATICLTLH